MGTDIRRATRAYEQWLRSVVENVYAPDVRYKHSEMRSKKHGAFPLLRATYYRWVEFFPAQCPELMKAVRVPSVGDAHVENFGTWRDADGRPIWGINDLDEADVLPFTNDLVRLATSFR